MMNDMLFKCVVWFGAFGGMTLLAYGVSKLNELIKAKVSNETMKGILVRLDDAALNAVKSVHQAFVSGLKDKDSFTDEDKKTAKAMAVDAMKAYLGKKGLEEAMKVLGFDDKKAEDKVEAALVDMKAGK